MTPAATPMPELGAISPARRRSRGSRGRMKTVHARFVHNTRLVDAVTRQAQGALTGSAGARAYYGQQRARGAGHQAALRQLANRLVGILHGCLRARTLYDEATAWAHQHGTTASNDTTRLLAATA